MINIAIIGMGGVGGYFGGLLARRYEADPAVAVHFVARGAHLEAIKKEGLILDSQSGTFIARPASATGRISDLPPLDYCLICVKGYDLVNAAEQVRARIRDSTVILPLLNGVDIFERMRAVVSQGYLHPACVYVGTHIEKPGLVQQRGPAGNIILGADPGRDREDRSILSYLEAAGIQYAWKDDPFAEIWNKYLFIAPFGLVTADSGLTIGEVLQSEAHLGIVKGVIEEMLALAARKGVKLPASAVGDTLARAAKFPADTRTSFQRDFAVPGKPDERDLFGGSILRMGRELGIPTPVTAGLLESIGRKKPQ
jgi:2-dehydropantoate 2-reductase